MLDPPGPSASREATEPRRHWTLGRGSGGVKAGTGKPRRSRAFAADGAKRGRTLRVRYFHRYRGLGPVASARRLFATSSVYRANADGPPQGSDGPPTRNRAASRPPSPDGL